MGALWHWLEAKAAVVVVAAAAASASAAAAAAAEESSSFGPGSGGKLAVLGAPPLSGAPVGGPQGRGPFGGAPRRTRQTRLQSSLGPSSKGAPWLFRVSNEGGPQREIKRWRPRKSCAAWLQLQGGPPPGCPRSLWDEPQKQQQTSWRPRRSRSRCRCCCCCSCCGGGRPCRRESMMLQQQKEEGRRSLSIPGIRSLRTQ